MKKRLIALVVGLLLVLPFTVFAETESMGLADTFAAEDIELSTKYKETDKQATIYLFRGQGCSHCLDLLNYLNSILGDYGSEFKLVSYEVWNNTDNADLEEEVADLLNADVQKGSVPFLIIGDQFYIGFKDDYGEDIKADIDDLHICDPPEVYCAAARTVRQVQNGSGPSLQLSLYYSIPHCMKTFKRL